MKTILILLTFFTFTTMTSQNSYEKGMSKAFELWGSQKPDEAINLFERIAKAEKENWIPYYYAAQVHIITTFGIKDAEEIESRLKKGQDFLNEARTFSKDNAEILIMEAMLNTAYVAYNPSVYGMTHSAKVEELYQRAKKLDPENPRATLNHAEWKMGSAKFWGKDPKAFCPEVEKAILYFEKEANNNIPFYPKWGMDQVTRIQQNCK
ncbi:hypothetical protein D1816_08075 [Aquimarina sp. AD10]|uniref:tetratricopeptide repeat protein n=1 Tax=Aquimarina TaxID=290174 RepID=UPI000E4CD40D|nr:MULTISPECIES: hypothetical protein [Aquimarina]AXT60308.1 hypothetical protein D1816_08075 [Aquimarina sp. AD10]RKN01257.1 hypothetical protein D7033_05405 [Aquimarina sp. AD10]